MKNKFNGAYQKPDFFKVNLDVKDNFAAYNTYCKENPEGALWIRDFDPFPCIDPEWHDDV